jgi:hypothetical protein
VQRLIFCLLKRGKPLPWELESSDQAQMIIRCQANASVVIFVFLHPFGVLDDLTAYLIGGLCPSGWLSGAPSERCHVVRIDSCLVIRCTAGISNWLSLRSKTISRLHPRRRPSPACIHRSVVLAAPDRVPAFPGSDSIESTSWLPASRGWRLAGPHPQRSRLIGWMAHRCRSPLSGSSSPLCSISRLFHISRLFQCCHEVKYLAIGAESSGGLRAVGGWTTRRDNFAEATVSFNRAANY